MDVQRSRERHLDYGVRKAHAERTPLVPNQLGPRLGELHHSQRKRRGYGRGGESRWRLDLDGYRSECQPGGARERFVDQAEG